jgi:hypothetical protein
MNRVLALLVTAAAMGGCSTLKVNTDYDPAADFARLQSYAWLPDPRPPTGDPRLDSSLLDARVRRAVDSQLAARGHREVSPDEADFLVTYHVALETKLDVETIHHGYGYGWGRWYGGMGGSTRVREYEQGTLLLDFVDPKTRLLLWRGSASARIRPSNSPEESQKRSDEAVAAMLKRFPPKPE